MPETRIKCYCRSGNRLFDIMGAGTRELLTNRFRMTGARHTGSQKIRFYAGTKVNYVVRETFSMMKHA